MASIKVNSQSYSGHSVTIVNGKVFINGKDVTPEGVEITISIEGNVEDLTVDACSHVQINGDARNVKTLSGDVRVKGDVNGNVQTMSGDVDCKNISGSVSTMSGDINQR